MNFLFHLFLSGNDPDILTGNFMGDFVKGRLGEEYPPALRRGIMLHRRIDSFADDEPNFRQSRQRLATRYGHYRSVLIDLYYDHFLAAQWHEWSTEPLPRYLKNTRSIIEERLADLPERLQGLLPYIFDELLPSYREIGGIATALARLSRRARRPNPLAGGEEDLVRHYEELREDFRRFTPHAQEFAAGCIAEIITRG